MPPTRRPIRFQDPLDEAGTLLATLQEQTGAVPPPLPPVTSLAPPQPESRGPRGVIPESPPGTFQNTQRRFTPEESARLFPNLDLPSALSQPGPVIEQGALTPDLAPVQTPNTPGLEGFQPAAPPAPDGGPGGGPAPDPEAGGIPPNQNGQPFPDWVLTPGFEDWYRAQNFPGPWNPIGWHESGILGQGGPIWKLFQQFQWDQAPDTSYQTYLTRWRELGERLGVFPWMIDALANEYRLIHGNEPADTDIGHGLFAHIQENRPIEGIYGPRPDTGGGGGGGGGGPGPTPPPPGPGGGGGGGGGGFPPIIPNPQEFLELSGGPLIEVGEDPLSEEITQALRELLAGGDNADIEAAREEIRRLREAGGLGERGQQLFDTVNALLAGEGPPIGGEMGQFLADEVRGIIERGGQLDSSIADARFQNARELLDRARDTQTTQFRAELADRGLLSLPGIPQGEEIGAAVRLEERLGEEFARAVRDIAIDENVRAEDRLIEALNLASGFVGQYEDRLLGSLSAATGLADIEARSLLDLIDAELQLVDDETTRMGVRLGAIEAGTRRQAVLSDIALRTLTENRLWNQFLAQFALDRAQTLALLQSGQIGDIMGLIQQFAAFLEQARLGQVGEE